MATFDELCADIKATPYEREELAWMLAMRRARQTWEQCRRAPDSIEQDYAFSAGALCLVVEL